MAAGGVFCIGKVVVDSEMKKTKDDGIINRISNMNISKIFESR